MTDLLRDNLHREAKQVAPVDLVARVRSGSARAARRRAVALSATAVVIATVLAGTVVVGFTRAARTPADTPTVAPTPSVSATLPPPSYGPLPAPNLSPTPAESWSAVDDPWPDRSLDGVALTVPDWPGADPNRSCAGDVVLAGGVYPFPRGALRQLRLVKSVPDGPAGVVALFYCDLGEVGRQFQVVAYRRDGAGRYELRGQVLASGTAGVAAMFDIAVAGPEIRIEVGDWADGRSVGEASHYSVQQWRAYGWSGAAFVQVGGPTTFLPNPNNYGVSVRVEDAVTFGAPRAERSRATLRATVDSRGPSPATHVTFTVTVPNSIELGSDSTACPAGRWATETVATSRRTFSCDLGTLAPGSTVELVLTLVVPSERLAGFASPTFGDVSVKAAGVSFAPRDSTDDHDLFAIDV